MINSNKIFFREKCHSRQTVIYFCLIIATLLFILLYNNFIEIKIPLMISQAVFQHPASITYQPQTEDGLNELKTNRFPSSLRIENTQETTETTETSVSARDQKQRTSLQNTKLTTLLLNKMAVSELTRKIDTSSKMEDQTTPFDESDITKSVEKGFLVYSDSCKIPDVDPYHPSIKHLIELTKPLNCSDYDPLTYTVDNTLKLNYDIAQSRSLTNFTCCYRIITRESEGESDNHYRYGDLCTNIHDEAVIKDEFIKVECSLFNGTVFYVEYYSFIHKKKEVEARCENATAKYSVLIVGVDSVSRLNMHRQFPKTRAYLVEEMGGLEMYGFNKVGDNTFPNLVPLLMGYDERELGSVCWNSTNDPLDKCDYLWKDFQQKGYRTLYAEDTPRISSFNYMKLGFSYQPTDYYFRNFILAYEDSLGRNKPLNCYLCVGSISETEAVLQYVKKFAKIFKDQPYFAFSWINSLTHDYLNMGSSGDHMYEAVFRELHTSGALNNTIVILMGDHGMRWGSIRTTYIGQLEERLPALVITLPPSFQKNYPSFTEKLQANRHRLVTPFDLFATLNHILHIEEDWNGVDTANVVDSLKKPFADRSLSLFTQVPANRSCEDAHIDEHWCTCQMSLEADPKSNNVKLVSLFIVNKINAKLKNTMGLCANLHLDDIQQARLWHPPHEQNSSYSQTSVYTVVLQTKPGNGIFEGTASFHPQKNDLRLLGTVSRLNLYGNQSSCVHDAILQKYCYCLHQ